MKKTILKIFIPLSFAFAIFLIPSYTLAYSTQINDSPTTEWNGSELWITNSTTIGHCFGGTGSLFLYDDGATPEVNDLGGISACDVSNITQIYASYLDVSQTGSMYFSACDGLGETPIWPTQTNVNCSNWVLQTYAPEPPESTPFAVAFADGDVASLLISLGVVTTGIFTFFVDSSLLWLTLAAALILIYAFRKFISLKTANSTFTKKDKQGIMANVNRQRGLQHLANKNRYKGRQKVRHGRRKK